MTNPVVNIDPLTNALAALPKGSLRVVSNMKFRRIYFPDGWQELESGWNVTSDLLAEFIRDEEKQEADIARLAAILASIPADEPEPERLHEWHTYIAKQMFNRGVRPPSAERAPHAKEPTDD